MLEENLHRFEAAILQAWPLPKWTGLTVLVACSGGADSTALLIALSRLAPTGTTLKVAHFNHRLRGVQSDADEQFVRELCVEFDLQFLVGRENSTTNTNSRQIPRDEATLRNDRYKFLKESALSIGARYIATAHQADDQVETVIHRWCRGAGLAGLSGIRFSRPIDEEIIVVRPLLRLWRSDVLAYLGDREQEFRNDTSNSSIDYTRNRIRNTIIPILENSVHSHAARNINQSAQQLAEILHWITEEASNFIRREVKFQNRTAEFSQQSIREIARPLAIEVLRSIWATQKWAERDMSSTKWNELYAFLITDVSGASGRGRQTSFPGNIIAAVNEGVVCLKSSDAI